MAPKKSKFIWFVIILFSLAIIANINFIIREIISVNLGYINYILNYYFFIKIIVIILSVIFLYKLYFLKKNVVKWAYIAFISNILSFLVDLFILFQKKIAEDFIGQYSSLPQEAEKLTEESADLINISIRIDIVPLLIIIVVPVFLFCFFFFRHLKKRTRNLVD